VIIKSRKIVRINIFIDLKVFWPSGPNNFDGFTGSRRYGKTVLCQSLENVQYFDCELPSVRREIEFCKVLRSEQNDDSSLLVDSGSDTSCILISPIFVTILCWFVNKKCILFVYLQRITKFHGYIFMGN